MSSIYIILEYLEIFLYKFKLFFSTFFYVYVGEIKVAYPSESHIPVDTCKLVLSSPKMPSTYLSSNKFTDLPHDVAAIV